MAEVIKDFGLEEGTCSWCERDGLVQHFLVRTHDGKLEHVWFCEACCANEEAWMF